MKRRKLHRSLRSEVEGKPGSAIYGSHMWTAHEGEARGPAEEHYIQLPWEKFVED